MASTVATAAAVTSLFFRKTRPVSLGPDLTRGKPSINVVQFDATLEEHHVSRAEVTSHAVERGADIVDHIRPLPQELTLTTVTTNTPTIFLATARGNGIDRVKTTHQGLLDLLSNGVLVDVVTTLRTYTDMAITSIDVTRTADTGNILSASISLQHIRIIDSEITTATIASVASPVNAARTVKQDKGQQPLPPATPPQETEVQKTFVLKFLTRSLSILRAALRPL